MIWTRDLEQTYYVTDSEQLLNFSSLIQFPLFCTIDRLTRSVHHS